MPENMLQGIPKGKIEVQEEARGQVLLHFQQHVLQTVAQVQEKGMKVRTPGNGSVGWRQQLYSVFSKQLMLAAAYTTESERSWCLGCNWSRELFASC